MALFIKSDGAKIPDCCGACSFQFGGHCTVQPSDIDDAFVPEEGKPDWCPLREHETFADFVRCDQCKHWVPGYITDTDDFIPPRCLDNHGVGWHANDYCSYWSRKESP